MKNLLIMFCLLVALSAYPLQMQHLRSLSFEPSGIELIEMQPDTINKDTSMLKATMYHYIGEPAKNIYAPLFSNMKH